MGSKPCVRPVADDVPIEGVEPIADQEHITLDLYSHGFPKGHVINVKIVAARGLQHMEWSSRSHTTSAAGSDTYCICEVPGKSKSRVITSACTDSLDPVWNHEATINCYKEGDSLMFTLFDQHVPRHAGHLARTQLSASRLRAGAFEGELPLAGTGADAGSMLHVKVCAVPRPPRSPRAALSTESSWDTHSQPPSVQSSLPPFRSQPPSVQSYTCPPRPSPRSDGLSSLQPSLPRPSPRFQRNALAELPAKEESEIRISLQRECETHPLGFRLDTLDKVFGIVTALEDVGAVADHNLCAREGAEIRIGDVVTEVNGVRGDAVGMVSELQTALDVEMSLTRCLSRFNVTIRKEMWSVGMHLTYLSGSTSLVICKLLEGPVKAWNSDNPGQEVKVNDRIEAVNGVRGVAEKLMEMVRVSDELDLHIFRVTC